VAARPAQERERLRTTFDSSADIYDEARPGYPDALFDDLVRLSAIPSQARLLEVGCGTGKATVPLAGRGYRVVCLEPGPNLAAVARRNLDPYPRVEIVESTLEGWRLEREAFDLAYAATSIGWVDPDVGYTKLASALRPGGCIAVFWNQHVYIDGEDGFWDAVQDVYRRHAPHMVGHPPRPGELPRAVAHELLRAELFEEIALRRYPWEETYDGVRYRKLMQTFSNHIALPEPQRSRLMDDVCALIDRDFGGRITKHHDAVLQLARRV
jgi:SAM-dependent methyltransferase